MSKKDREGNRAARAAAIQKEQANRERNRSVLIVVAVLVVLAALVSAGVLLPGGQKPAASQGPLPTAVARGQALVVGDNPDAKVKVVTFEDFLCPYWRELESASRTYLRKDAEAGKVLVEYRPFHLLQDPYSTRALTAWAAVLQKGTGKQALGYHDLLYDKQPYEADPDKPDAAELIGWAGKSGVKDDDVINAIGKDNGAFVSATSPAANEADVQGTSTVVVNDKVLQGPPAEHSDELESLIARG